MAGLLVRAVTDLGHRRGTLEATADAAVDTGGLAPRSADALEAVRLVPLETVRPLLDNRNASGSHFGLIRS